MQKPWSHYLMIMRCHHWIHIQHAPIKVLRMLSSLYVFQTERSHPCACCAVQSRSYMIISILIISWTQMCIYTAPSLSSGCCQRSSTHVLKQRAAGCQQLGERAVMSNKSTLLKWHEASGHSSLTCYQSRIYHERPRHSGILRLVGPSWTKTGGLCSGWGRRVMLKVCVVLTQRWQL